VLLNLATNGMDAMMAQETRRELVLSSRRHGRDEIEIGVKDSGSGIDTEVAGRVFDPFFTTKAQGIGMGLAISRTIIEAHDGRIWMSSEESGGSSFQFIIPVRS
jgi:C4-dicarboxylate-specific signal transduction histidine kinase